MNQDVLNRFKEAIRGRVGPDLALEWYEAEGGGAYAEWSHEIAKEVALKGGVELKKGAGQAVVRPALSLTNNEGTSITFHVLPMGHQLDPFVEAISLVSHQEKPPQWARPLELLKDPAEVLIFVGHGCAHCPKAVEVGLGLALASPSAHVSVIDALAHEDLAKELGAKSVPLTVIDRQIRFGEVVPGSKIVEAIVGRGGPDHQKRVFEAAVNLGDFAAAAQAVLHGAWAVFIDAWRNSTFNARVGLMLTAEKALELDPRGLDELVPMLIGFLSSEDGGIRGDTADLLGRIGDTKAVPAIKMLLEDPLEDVVEVARDVLDAFESK